MTNHFSYPTCPVSTPLTLTSPPFQKTLAETEAAIATMESALETAEARYNLVCNAVLKAGEGEYTHDSDAETEAVDDAQFDALTNLINSLNDVSNCGT